MGDVVMTTPALRALKESFGAHITLLTSTMGYGITPFIPCIDEVIVANLPWIKTSQVLEGQEIKLLTERLQKATFDAAVIFTVYSQSALPAALLTMLAGIPKRLAYCRENPYTLLTDWVPDPEPYRFIQHQVERDLKLVNSIGAFTSNDQLFLQVNTRDINAVHHKLQQKDIASSGPYIIFHPGVSEPKRQYPETYWIETGKLLTQWNIPVLITGAHSEYDLAERICRGIGTGAFNVAGLLDVGEFIALINLAAVVISVNTATVHIAAAMQTPVIVLYALTNPQHTPWKVSGKVLYFSVAEPVRSKNEVVSYVHDKLYSTFIDPPLPAEIVAAAKAVWPAATVEIAQ